MELMATKTVRELAVEIPGATRIFEQLGIDYCCGGQRSLADACSTAGLSAADVEKTLATVVVAHEKWAEPNVNTETLEGLIGHIVTKHHVFTRQEITRLPALAEKVYAAHSENHPELKTLKQLVGELATDLAPHMMKEENILFPFIINMESEAKQGAPLSPAPFGTVANPIRMMMFEHDRAGEILAEIRKVSADYTLPGDACISYQTLYEAMAELERDLHQHIHLENNILFPRAVEMESGFSS